MKPTIMTLKGAIMSAFILLLVLVTQPTYAHQNEQISIAINNYIQGTSYNYPEKISEAFYHDANLLLEKKDQPVWRVPAKEYVSWFTKNKTGRFTGRIGEILNIDVSGTIATAKVEIIIPDKERRFIDLFLLKKIANDWKIISKTAVSESSIQHGKRILFIVSNAHFHGTSTLPVGASFSEIINAYAEFKKAGFTVDFVSPEGGAIPLSYIDTSNPQQKEFLYNNDFMYALAHTKTPDKIKASDYKAVHYIGGSSAMYGVADNKEIQALVMEIYEEHNGIVSSVCHGTAGIAFLQLKNGEYLVSGKRISGYPDEYENPSRDYFKHFPFQITQTIEKHGGDFKYSPRNTAHVEVDGRVITGQNYLSSALVAKEMIKQLRLNH
ncbi:nuclear transport factor 2 family protein [Colwelliaceae bacterium 6441]